MAEKHFPVEMLGEGVSRQILPNEEPHESVLETSLVRIEQGSELELQINESRKLLLVIGGVGLFSYIGAGYEDKKSNVKVVPGTEGELKPGDQFGALNIGAEQLQLLVIKIP